jgi:thiamine biosynthesis lipoprotein
MTLHRHIFATMGTVASLTWDAPPTQQADPGAIQSIFDSYDSTYSLFTAESELSQIASGRLALENASSEVRDTYAMALEWRAATNGDFSPHRPDGVIDLSGVVKALAMRDAETSLLNSAVTNWCLNVGGDVLVSGADEGGDAWTVGIVDPVDRNSLLMSAALRGSRRACATSGSAERGDHIWTVSALPTEFVQATVIADDIITADVLATAIIAGGSVALDRICATWDIDAMTIDRDGSIRMTPGFAPRALAGE